MENRIKSSERAEARDHQRRDFQLQRIGRPTTYRQGSGMRQWGNTTKILRLQIDVGGPVLLEREHEAWMP